MRTVLMYFVACAAIGAVRAQQSGSPEPLFRAVTRIVDVTVVATQPDGSGVRDLSVADIRLFDDNHQQVIQSFEPVRTARPSESPAGGTATPRRPRLSMLLLDSLNTDFSDQFYARHAAVRALEQIPAGDRVAIFVLGDSLRLLHDFTSDATSLRVLLQRFSGEPPRGQQSSANGSFSAEFSYSDLLRSRDRSSGPWAAFRERQRILQTLEALSAIAGLVKNVPGQKTLLWLSAAFPLQIAATGSSGDRRPGVELFQDAASRTSRALNGANVTIYPIDARGLSVNRSAYINIETMKELAEQTGGKAYYSSNDLASMVRSALADSIDSYVLTYSPSELRDDGRFHRIRLQTNRHGVRLRYRPGYCADASPER